MPGDVSMRFPEHLPADALTVCLTILLVTFLVGMSTNSMAREHGLFSVIDDDGTIFFQGAWPLPRGNKGWTGSNSGRSDIIEPRILWLLEEAERPAALVSGDVSGDGKAEVVFGTDSGLLHVISGTDGKVVWTEKLSSSQADAYLINAGTDRLSVLAKAALEGGRERLCLISYPERLTVWCYDLFGSLGTPVGGFLPSGDVGIYVGFADFSTGEAGILVLDLDGMPQWKVITGWNPISMTLGDIDGAWGDEIVATTLGKAIAVKPQDGVQPWTVIWSYDVPGSPLVLSHVADLVDDVTAEVLLRVSPLAGAPGLEFSALRGWDGTPLWSLGFNDSTYPPAIGDFDGDGKSEVAVLSLNGNLTVLDGLDGGMLWQRALGQVTSPPITLDLGGEGIEDIIVGTESGIQAVRGHDGRQLWGISLGTNVSYLAAADLDGDGWVEILGISDVGLFAIDQSDSSILWILLLGGVVPGSIIVAVVLLWRRSCKK
jgi:outer membrane protein assembly factor BamB